MANDSQNDQQLTRWEVKPSNDPQDDAVRQLIEKGARWVMKTYRLGENPAFDISLSTWAKLSKKKEKKKVQSVDAAFFTTLKRDVADYFKELEFERRQKTNSFHNKDGTKSKTWDDLESRKSDELRKDEVWQLQQEEVLPAAISKLQPKNREILTLRFDEGLTRHQVAERFNLSDSQVRTWQEKAETKLRELVDSADSLDIPDFQCCEFASIPSLIKGTCHCGKPVKYATGVSCEPCSITRSVRYHGRVQTVPICGLWSDAEYESYRFKFGPWASGATGRITSRSIQGGSVDAPQEPAIGHVGPSRPHFLNASRRQAAAEELEA
ncbi:MAG: sigma-70 family RNA polymerase sigma factor [Pirellulaceae bacterium]